MFQTKIKSISEIAQIAPAILADSKSPNRSERYRFLSTITVVEDLMQQGWQPVQASQRKLNKRSDASEMMYRPHFIQFKNENLVRNDEELSLVLFNSHDGFKPLEISLGIFRFVCSNGLISGETHHSFSIRHSGYSIEDAIQVSKSANNMAFEIFENVDMMKSKKLNSSDARNLALEGAKLRFGTENISKYNVDSILASHRPEDNRLDNGGSLWTIFNRTQENLTRGRVEVFNEAIENAPKVRKPRPITDIIKNAEFQKSLWNLALDFA